MISVEVNVNHVSCDNCEAHPSNLIVLQGATAVGGECLSICRRCFRSLRKEVQEFDFVEHLIKLGLNRSRP